MTRRVVVAVVVALLALAAAPAGIAAGRPAPGRGAARAVPGPPNAPEYWFARWHVHQLWASGARGQGVTIAEIDSGVNARVPQLAGRVEVGHDFGHGGSGRIDRDIQLFGHGTAMASIMVARPGPLGITGLAPAASILPLAVPLNGTTDGQHAAKVPAAIRWAVRHGAKVISMSIGGERFPGAGNRSCPAAEQRAVFAALAAGVVVIAAVGNTGPRANTVEEPGVCLGVVAVGAVDRAGAVAPFSARQPYLSLVAPGVDVPSLGRVAGQAFSGSGTSQAAALVSATAALVWSRYPRLSGREVVSRLLATVDRRGAERSAAYGSGELDAYRAVTATVSPSAPNPVYAAAAPFLRRAAALQRGLGRRPAPATSVRPRGGGKAPALIAPRPSSGGVATGTAEPRSSAAGASSLQLPIGIALASLGGVALLALGAVGLRRGASSRRSNPA